MTALALPIQQARRVERDADVLQFPMERVRPAVREEGNWRWTDRGIAVILGLWVALLVAAVVTISAAFFAVPNTPIGANEVKPAAFGYAVAK